MSLLAATVLVYLIWALLVHPDDYKERIIIEALKTYQMELQAGITESKISDMIPAQQEKSDDKTCETRSEHPGGDDSGRSGRDAGTDRGEEAGTRAH